MGKPKVPKAPDPVEPPTPTESAEARAEARRRLLSRRGRESTILTGGLGDPIGTAPVQRPTLLGGGG